MRKLPIGKPFKIELYTDYRLFLKDHYQYTKDRNKNYSYRVFCKKAGINSPSFYNEVVTGKRNITKKYLPNFIIGLKLSDNDAKYFTLMVEYGHASSDKEKLDILEKMRGLRQRVEPKLVPLNLYAYYSKWYNAVIRELVSSMKWDDDYKKLATTITPSLSTQDVKEAVQLLHSLGFIVKQKDGSFLQSDLNVSSGSEVTSLAIRQLNREMTQKGQEAIDTFPPTERDVSSMVLGISKQGYEIIKREIQEFYKRVISVANEDKESSRVFGLALQLFPLSKDFSESRINSTNTEVSNDQ